MTVNLIGVVKTVGALERKRESHTLIDNRVSHFEISHKVKIEYY